MNKAQKRILIRKLLPKFILLFFIVAIGISLIILRYKGKKAEVEIKEFMESGGGQSIIMAFDMYDSLTIDNLIIKYPKEYKVTGKFGDVIGGYSLKSAYSNDEFAIKYIPKKNIGDPTHISIEEAIGNLEKELVNYLSQQNSTEPELSEIVVERIGKINVLIKRIEYNETSLLIYGIESKNHYLLFTSYLQLLLNGIMQNIVEI